MKVNMPRGDWEIVMMILTDARDSERFAYFDHIIDAIDLEFERQEG